MGRERGEGPNDGWHSKGYDYWFARDSDGGGGSDAKDFGEDMVWENNSYMTDLADDITAYEEKPRLSTRMLTSSNYDADGNEIYDTGPRNPKLAAYYAREYKFNYESTVAMGMLQEFIFETIDFGEFSFSDLREYVVEHSNPNESLKEQNEFYSKVVEAYKQVEGFLPDKGKLSNTQKLKLLQLYRLHP
jgi:hypothetical protein